MNWLANDNVAAATMPDEGCLLELFYLASLCDDDAANAEAVGDEHAAAQWALSALACRYAIKQLAARPVKA